jgi:hypothetical protein
MTPKKADPKRSNFPCTLRREAGFDNPHYRLSAEEAADRNISASPQKRLESAAHELAHHMYAEHLDLKPNGITVGYREGAEDSSAGEADLATSLRGKVDDTTTMNYMRAVLANGFGEESVLGTPQKAWHCIQDLEMVAKHVKRLGWSLQQTQEFFNEAYTQARDFFDDPTNKAQLAHAAKQVSSKHWAAGKVSPQTLKHYLKGGQ